MSDDANPLSSYQPAREFFVGIDSDGCVFDTMEIKHKECFTPMFIKHFGLQAASKYAREAWEFVNLYSKTRGINRFPALSNALNLLADRHEVQARGVKIMPTDVLDSWIAAEPKLTNSTLKAAIDGGLSDLALIYGWSTAVNDMIADMVFGVPPFPLVRECLVRLEEAADLMVVSQTPTPALEREWAEHDVARHVRLIAGQELGSKTDHIRLAAGGRYAPKHVLMIGDAPGDFKAAKGNSALFFPIVPGREEASWQRFHDEGIERFLTGQFAGAYEDELLREFQASLPEHPAWQH